jgi:outer membrane immunogenic protein
VATSATVGKCHPWCSARKRRATGLISSGNKIGLQTGLQNQTKIDGLGLFTGPIGCAWDRALFYVKGGAAVTDNKYNVFTAPGGGLVDNANETRRGASVGVDFEYAIVPSWSLGFEYDHLFMGNNDVIFVSGTINMNVDIFTARINYKFGGPVVAR